ncbi:MAG: VanZ family protein [Nitrospinales bacterium]
MILQKYIFLWHIAGWGLVALIIYLSIMPVPADLGVEGGDKLAHFAAYFVLMWWFAQVLAKSRYLSLAFACIVLGGGLELMQCFIEGRFCEFADVLANSAGVLVAWGISKMWSIFPALKTSEEGIRD